MNAMNFTSPRRLLVVAAVMLFAGCAVGPNYHRPAVQTPEQFRFATSAATNSLGDLPWWQVFDDPVLQELIRVALTNNYDLKKAVARVEQARNAAAGARAPFLPQINYGGQAGRGRNAVFNNPASLGGETKSSALLDLSATWEIDFWGRLRRQSESAQAQYLASKEVRRGVMITVVSQVASSYFQLQELDEELQILQAATNAYAGTCRIFSDRRANGVASKLETDRAFAALAGAQAAIPNLELQIATTENALNVLLGRLPGPVARGSRRQQHLPPPAIPTGLPSELLRRRPDVLAAEQSLVAANASIGTSVANFFPRLGLTTMMGNVSPELSAFTAGSANAWNVGATLAGPLFQGGALRAQYHTAQAQFDEARANYEQTVLMSFQEVADALITRQKLATISVYQAQAAVALTSAVQLSTDRYLNGKSDYDEVLQAQQALYPTQLAEVQAQLGELLAVVKLYKALGGGWQMPEQGK